MIRRVETKLIRTALEDVRGNKAEAAQVRGIQRRLLYEEMAVFGIAE